MPTKLYYANLCKLMDVVHFDILGFCVLMVNFTVYLVNSKILELDHESDACC